jgi:hypothetical protein
MGLSTLVPQYTLTPCSLLGLETIPCGVAKMQDDSLLWLIV